MTDDFTTNAPPQNGGIINWEPNQPLVSLPGALASLPGALASLPPAPGITTNFKLDFSGPLQPIEMVPMSQLNSSIQLWIDAKAENEQLKQHIAELEAKAATLAESSIRLFVLKWTPDPTHFPEAKEDIEIDGALYPAGLVFVAGYPFDENYMKGFASLDDMLFDLNEFGTPGEPVFLNEAAQDAETPVSAKEEVSDDATPAM